MKKGKDDHHGLKLTPIIPPSNNPRPDAVDSEKVLSIEQPLERGYDYSIPAVIKGILGPSFGQAFKFFTLLMCSVLSLAQLVGLSLSIGGKSGWGKEDEAAVLSIGTLATFLALVIGLLVIGGMSAVDIRRASGLPASWGNLIATPCPDRNCCCSY